MAFKVRVGTLHQQFVEGLKVQQPVLFLGAGVAGVPVHNGVLRCNLWDAVLCGANMPLASGRETDSQ